ncbi:TPR domain protein, partial [Aphelenchoides avenae]
DPLDPLSLRFVALWFDSDSSEIEFDAPTSIRQPPTSFREIVNTDMVNHNVTDVSPPNNDPDELLQKGQYSQAYAMAERAIGSGDDERLLSILGDAAYGMRKWELAVGHYKELCEKFPSNEDAKERLRRAQSRLAESRTGIYDIAKFHESREKGEMDIDVADFIGPIEVVDVPGKGKQAVTPKVRKGFVATQDVQKGTLLMVSKAFAIVDANSTEAIAQGVADKLQLRPEMAAEINALYDGNERVPGAPIDQGIPDIERPTQICKYGFDVRGKQRGLWILPSYFNSSCLSK